MQHGVSMQPQSNAWPQPHTLDWACHPSPSPACTSCPNPGPAPAPHTESAPLPQPHMHQIGAAATAPMYTESGPSPKCPDLGLHMPDWAQALALTLCAVPIQYMGQCYLATELGNLAAREVMTVWHCQTSKPMGTPTGQMAQLQELEVEHHWSRKTVNRSRQQELLLGSGREHSTVSTQHLKTLPLTHRQFVPVALGRIFIFKFPF